MNLNTPEALVWITAHESLQLERKEEKAVG